METLSKIHAQFKLKPELYKKVRKAIKCSDLIDDDYNKFLAELPSKYRYQLSYEMYKEKLAGIEYFADKSPALIAYLAPKLKPQSVPTDEEIYFAGHPADDIFFIKTGRVSLYTNSSKITNKKNEVDELKDEQEFEVGRIHSGHLFGETDILFNGNVRQYTAKCTEASELLMLNKMEFKECISLFRNENEELQKNAKTRASYWEKQAKEFIEKAKKKAQRDKLLRIIDDASKPQNLEDKKLMQKQRRLMEKNEKVDYVIRQIDDKTQIMKQMEEKLNNLSSKLMKFMQSNEGIKMSEIIRNQANSNIVEPQVSDLPNQVANKTDQILSEIKTQKSSENDSPKVVKNTIDNFVDNNNPESLTDIINSVLIKKKTGKEDQQNKQDRNMISKSSVEMQIKIDPETNLQKSNEISSALSQKARNKSLSKSVLYPNPKNSQEILANQNNTKEEAGLFKLSFGQKGNSSGKFSQNLSDLAEKKGFQSNKEIIKKNLQRKSDETDNLSIKSKTPTEKNNKSRFSEINLKKYNTLNQSSNFNNNTGPDLFVSNIIDNQCDQQIVCEKIQEKPSYDEEINSVGSYKSISETEFKGCADKKYSRLLTEISVAIPEMVKFDDLSEE